MRRTTDKGREAGSLRPAVDAHVIDSCGCFRGEFRMNWRRWVASEASVYMTGVRYLSWSVRSARHDTALVVTIGDKQRTTRSVALLARYLPVLVQKTMTISAAEGVGTIELLLTNGTVDLMLRLFEMWM